jgi:hypothetical protein
MIDKCIVQHLSLRSASAKLKVMIPENRNQYSFENIATIIHLQVFFEMQDS